VTDGGRLIPCSEAVRLLWDYLDRALSPEDRSRVEGHLTFCRNCCGELEFAKELQAFLASNAVDEIPPDVRARLEGFAGEIVEDR
jgi:anti-sigma factor (TIGR02949 family)